MEPLNGSARAGRAGTGLSETRQQLICFDYNTVMRVCTVPKHTKFAIICHYACKKMTILCLSHNKQPDIVGLSTAGCRVLYNVF